MNTPSKKRARRKNDQTDLTPSTEGGDFDDLAELADLMDNNSLMLKFDMDFRFGPCRGLTRLERYQRAQELKIAGLEEYDFVSRAAKGGHSFEQSVFDQRLKGGL